MFSKQATYSSTSTLVQAGDLQGLVPVLLDLIEKPTALRTSATFTLGACNSFRSSHAACLTLGAPSFVAYIIADDEEVQKLTVKLKALDILRGVLEQPPRLSQPYATPASLEEHSRTAEVSFGRGLPPLRDIGSHALPIVRRASSFASPASAHRARPFATKSSRPSFSHSSSSPSRTHPPASGQLHATASVDSPGRSTSCARA